MSRGKLLAIVVVWLVLFGVGAVAWKYVVKPGVDHLAEEAELETIQETGSESKYKHRLTLALDSFSGYAVLRSAALRDELARRSIKLNLLDDQADYGRRLANLQSGRVQMAAFTIDALLKTSAQAGVMPATIVAVIDETRGADAVVADKAKFAAIDDLNRPDTRLVLTPDSPSETLARVIMSNFNLDLLTPDAMLLADSVEDVYRRYENSPPDSSQVYVLWEPYVAKVLENPNMHVLVDSERVRGYIVDVLVVGRDYLGKHRAVVKDVIECYFRAAYQYRRDAERVALVLEDARRQNQPLTSDQAKRLVEGIWWKNTLENLAHFGLLTDSSLEHMEDMISKITEALVATSAIRDDPTKGRPFDLYYKDLLGELQDEGFHPGVEAESIRDESIRLRTLTDSEWQSLTRGTLKVPPLVFATGSARLLDGSRRILDDLAKTLESAPYYVIIRGNASRRGNLEKNQQLASDRARAAAEYLQQRGIAPQRIRSVGVEPSGEMSVTFMLGQLPY